MWRYSDNAILPYGNGSSQSCPSSAGETGQPSINARTNKYQYTRQSLTRALSQGKRYTKGLYTTYYYYHKRNIIYSIPGVAIASSYMCVNPFAYKAVSVVVFVVVVVA